MNSPENGKTFIFNLELDSENLQALYGDDYAYIEEVFGTVLNEYGQLSDNILSCYAARNISALKAAVHKIKPIFGFVGLTQIQQQCQQFEHVCQESSGMDMIERDYGALKEVLIRSKVLIEDEKKKLELFNRNNA
jgi:HPt (histidine-containing phosphotransfer) domain-containing protein